MEHRDIQAVFFQHIKNSLPPHLSFVDEIAEILEISNDSAYRRIRGEKQLSFEEIKKLCTFFKISLDQLLNLNSDSIVFSGKFINHETYNYETYMQGLFGIMNMIQSFQQKEMYYLSKDIPIFYYYMFPEIGCFKNFAWLKTYFQFPEFSGQKFTFKPYLDKYREPAEKIAELYVNVPSVEIMNADNILTTLRQIEYYKDSDLFQNEGDIEIVYNSLEQMVGHMELQASEGKKFMKGKQPTAQSTDYKLFANDFIIGDNSFLIILNQAKISVLTHSALNPIMTRDQNFGNYTHDNIKNILRKSSLISGVGERERAIFFNLIRARIKAYRENRVKTLGKL
jgi:BetR domain